MDMTLYPSNSFVEFRDGRDDASDPWFWYPGFKPDENGENAGTLIISPYIAVNF